VECGHPGGLLQSSGGGSNSIWFTSGSKRQPNLVLVFLCLFYVVVYFVTDAYLLFVLDLGFHYLAKGLAGKNGSKMTYFLSGWM